MTSEENRTQTGLYAVLDRRYISSLLVSVMDINYSVSLFINARARRTGCVIVQSFRRMYTPDLEQKREKNQSRTSHLRGDALNEDLYFRESGKRTNRPR